MTHRIVGFSGSLNAPSKTRALVDLALAKGSARYGIAVESYDLTELLPSLFSQAAGLGPLDASGRTIIDSIVSADALVVGSRSIRAAIPASSSTCSI